MKMTSLLALCVAVSAALLLSGARSSAAETACDAMKLKVCAWELMWDKPPSKECCAALQDQKLCFCTYMSDPELKPIIRSDRTKKMVEKCGVKIPEYCITDPPIDHKKTTI